MKQYTVQENSMETDELGEYTTYGLKVWDEAGNCIWSGEDITTEKDTLLRLAGICSILQPSEVHMNEIIEDFLAVCP
ncbi:MAG: hypothetical protein E7390_08085 [Ruminococcaceae bacterium]|nr:hypothetical protein [Oscillospiraceae bacterium]